MLRKMHLFTALLTFAPLLLTGCHGGALRTEDAPPPAPSSVAPANTSLKPRTSPLAAGTPAPPFTLLDQKGIPVSLTELASGKGSVILFTPGPESAASRPAYEWARRHASFLKQRGLELLLAGPGTVEQNAAVAQREGLRLALLSDPAAWVARAYGAVSESGQAGNLIVLIGPDQRVHYVDAGLSGPEQLLMAAETQPGKKKEGFFEF